MTGESLRLEILGPVRLWRDGTELDPGPRQQAYLLALLLAREGTPVSTTELVETIWDADAPASALNVIHRYIGALRRLFEPDFPARSTGAYLHRRGNGYLFTAGAGTLDLVTFRDLARQARAAYGETALERYIAALECWHGPVGGGLAGRSARIPAFAAVEAELFDVCVRATGVAVAVGRPELVLPALRLAAAIAPLHEPVQASLVNALRAAGQQAEALAVFRAVNERLVEDLGLDAGPALRAAHLGLLRQGRPQAGDAGPVAVAKTAGGLVGRAPELTVLRRTVDWGLQGGDGISIVEGEPGAGKTRLLEEIAAEAGQRGATVLWGHCLEGNGTPSMWPWVQAVGAVLDSLPPAERHRWLAGELGRLVKPGNGVAAGQVLPDTGMQFRLFEAVVGVIGIASQRRPLLLIIDDLQWADVASLQLLSHLVTRLPASTVFIGALRNRAPTPGSALSRVLVALSRVASHRRLRLGPLNAHEAAELIRSEFGHDPGPDTARVIHTRAGGNPFLIRELSRLLAGDAFTAEGPLTRDAVPATVIDVVKDRISGLEEDARDLLQTAAVMGRDVDLGLLAAASGLDIEKCLERLEPVEELGIVEPARGDPFSIRFAHDLVRESVVRDIPPSQVSRLHLRVADALERAATRDEFMVERVGHHLLAAGPMADPARTASMLIRAGRLAAGKSALEAAERQLRSAADVARRAQHSELELSALTQLTAVVGMRSMYGFSSHDLLRRAERLALSLGRDGEAAGFLFSRWAAHSHSVELHHSGPLARRLLEAGEASGDPFMLAYGLQAWGVYQWHLGNVAEGHRYLVRSTDAVLDLPPRDDDPVRHDLQLLMLGVLVETTMLSGDVETAQTLAATMEQAAGDNPYTVTIWACFAARTAVLACDPAEVMRVAEHGLPADPGFSFVYLGTYLRLARCWASAMTGASRQDAIAEAERIMAAHLEDPAKSCVATWHALLAEMRLSGGDTAGAAAALDRADFCLDAYGQRYPEGLILLTRARLQHACGEPIATVRAAAEKARAFSAERGAHLFAARAEKFLSEIG